MTASREQLLQLVERSPACVAAHDRAGWLDLFGDDAFIEDPVGSAPAPKAGGVLGRFYDTFIAPHQIRFKIRRDHVLGGDVFRDAIIHTRVRAGVEVKVEAYLLYQIDEQGGVLRARRMAAHWTLGRMTAIAMGLGPRAWVAMTGLFLRMIRVMGLPWVGAYLASLWRGIGGRGIAAAAALSRGIESRDGAALLALFIAGGGEVEIGPRPMASEELLSALPAGCRLHIEAPVAAGYSTAFRFRLTGAAPPLPAEGLGLLEFDAASRRIRRARFFPAPV